MKIKEITWQNRNDFYAVMECEHCAATAENKCGYDDHYYHAAVIPGMFCKSCGFNRAGKKEVKIEASAEVSGGE